jgi:protein TonB
MNRDLALSALAAAALHGGLFFGYAPAHKPAPPREPVEAIPVVPMPIYKPDDPEPEVVRRDADEKPKPEAPKPVPTLADHVTIANRDDITVPYKPTPEVKVPGVDTIPTVYGSGGEGLKPHILSVIDLDRTPRTRSQIAPVYPFEAKRTGLAGSVNVEFTVDENGRVSDPRIVSSTDRVFEQATIAAVLKWRFEPGTREGRAVRFRMIAPVVFNLND